MNGMRPYPEKRQRSHRFGAYRWDTIQSVVSSWAPTVFLSAIIITSISLFFWFLLATDVFVVKAVTVLDAREQTTTAIQDIVEQQLAAAPFGRTIFLVQTGTIADAIRRHLPAVRTVSVIRTLPGTLRVVIQEKKPAVILLSNGTYYFVDETGVPFEEAHLETLPGIVLPTVKNDDQSAVVTIGVPAVAPSFVSFITYVQKHLPEVLAAEVVEIHIPSLAAREVHVLLNSNWRLLFDVTRDPAKQLGILQRVANELISPEEQTQLQYIDLRIKDRVYYRSGLPPATDR